MIEPAHVAEVMNRCSKLTEAPYTIAGSSVLDGFDCVTLVREVWRIIGDVTGDADRWRFPMPPIYDTDTITVESLAEWSSKMTPSQTPSFGAVANLRGSHVGVLIGERCDVVIHTRKSTGVILQRLRFLRPLVRDYWTLKTCD